MNNRKKQKIASKICFIIECKNLFCNLEINNIGDFLHTMEFGRKKKKEGIYSLIPKQSLMQNMQRKK